MLPNQDNFTTRNHPFPGHNPVSQPSIHSWSSVDMRQTPTMVPSGMPLPNNLPPQGMSLPSNNSRNSMPGKVQSGTPLLRQKRTLVLGSILGCILLVLSISGYYYWKASNSNTTDVILYQVSGQNANQDIGGGGIVYPNQQVNISYPVVERVVSVYVKAGDAVTLNQPLIQLDPSQLNIQITEASNEVASAQALLNSVSTTGNSVTIAQAQQAYNIAKGKYDALVSQLSSFTLHNGKLIAPLGGIVTAVNINPNEIFTANTVLMTIMDESTAIVRVKIPLMSLGKVHLGQTAIVTPSALPNVNLQGTVNAIIPQADSQTDTYEVRIAVPNQNDILLPGMSAFVRIQEQGHAFVVPRLAVLNPDRESAVFVVHSQHAYLQRVHIAGRSADSIFIDKGVSSGDQVVLVGLNSVQNGQEVRVKGLEGAKA